jgi:16S rRNA C967 or C1407 C5-methylase (RsmB/RsmF family)
VVHYILCKYKNLELENIDIIKNKYINTKSSLKSFGKYIFQKEVSEKSRRILPGEFTEGFYIAKFRKCHPETYPNAH